MTSATREKRYLVVMLHNSVYIATVLCLVVRTCVSFLIVYCGGCRHAYSCSAACHDNVMLFQENCFGWHILIIRCVTKGKRFLRVHILIVWFILQYESHHFVWYDFPYSGKHSVVTTSNWENNRASEPDTEFHNFARCYVFRVPRESNLHTQPIVESEVTCVINPIRVFLHIHVMTVNSSSCQNTSQQNACSESKGAGFHGNASSSASCSTIFRLALKIM